jgi:hypothetical protein
MTDARPRAAVACGPDSGAQRVPGSGAAVRMALTTSVSNAADDPPLTNAGI